MIRLCLALAALLLTSTAAAEPKPTIALTFDHYRSTYDVARPILARHGLVATYYVDPRSIDAAGGPRSAELAELQRAGWQIGAYSGNSLFTVFIEDGEAAARQAIGAIARGMAAKGFAATSLAPAQRAWSKRLGALAAPLFDNVRVIDLPHRQGRIDNPHYIRGGERDSLSAADTAASVAALVEQLTRDGGLQTIIIHQVGNDAEPAYSVGADVLEALCRAIAAARDRGQLEAKTFDQAVATWRR